MGNLHVLETTEILDYLDNSFFIMELLANIRLQLFIFQVKYKVFFFSVFLQCLHLDKETVYLDRQIGRQTHFPVV